MHGSMLECFSVVKLGPNGSVKGLELESFAKCGCDYLKCGRSRSSGFRRCHGRIEVLIYDDCVFMVSPVAVNSVSVAWFDPWNYVHLFRKYSYIGHRNFYERSVSFKDLLK